MELNEFVTESIIQITKGIKKAQEDLKGEWVRINPKPAAGVNVVSPMLYTAENGAGVFPLTPSTWQSALKTRKAEEVSA